MNEVVDGQRISLSWALICMSASLVVAILLNETVANGRGKAIFLAVFATSFIFKTFQKLLREKRVLTFLTVVGIFHILLVFVFPSDDRIAGAWMLPVGVIDIGMFYFLFRFFVRNNSDWMPPI